MVIQSNPNLSRERYRFVWVSWILCKLSKCVSIFWRLVYALVQRFLFVLSSLLISFYTITYTSM